MSAGTENNLDSVRQQLSGVEGSIVDGSYKKGAWQSLVATIDRLDLSQKQILADEVSRVSRALHKRNRFPQIPFLVGFVLEFAILGLGVMLVRMDHVFLVIAGIAGLALTLQPTIKVITGLIVGVRYEYMYLWYFEPRFKMQYGSYLAVPSGARLVFHLAGSIGTPLAMFVGFVRLLPVNMLMAYVCLIACVGALAMQIGAFIAEWMGVRNIAGYRLSTLTSPATAAFELKKMRNRS